jgi:hypothetical protein
MEAEIDLEYLREMNAKAEYEAAPETILKNDIDKLYPYSTYVNKMALLKSERYTL